MKAQIPAEGIMQTGNWPDAHSFHIECECSDPNHAVDMWIEVNPDRETESVALGFYVQGTAPFWQEGWNRFRAAWQVLTQGYYRTENHLILSKQAAVNLTGAVEQSIKKLEKYEKSI